jgi:hypothetical protein
VTLVGGTDFQLRGESNLATGPIIHTESSTGQILAWCRGQDLNLHALRHWILSPARLPIPPPRPEEYLNSNLLEVILEIWQVSLRTRECSAYLLHARSFASLV